MEQQDVLRLQVQVIHLVQLPVRRVGLVQVLQPSCNLQQQPRHRHGVARRPQHILEVPVRQLHHQHRLLVLLVDGKAPQLDDVPVVAQRQHLGKLALRLVHRRRPAGEDLHRHALAGGHKRPALDDAKAAAPSDCAGTLVEHQLAGERKANKARRHPVLPNFHTLNKTVQRKD